MEIRLEENYRLNGTDSWIHCIQFNFKECINTPYHYHEYIEILYFLEGEGNLLVNGKSMYFCENNLFIINSQRTHALNLIKPCKYICIKVMPDILYSNERFCDEFKYVLPFVSEERNEYFFSQSEIETLKIGNLLTNINNEWNVMDFGFELSIKSNLLEFFSKILRYLKTNDLIFEASYITPEIKKAIIYISENYATVSEKELSEICNLSYNHFSYLFKKTIGRNFKNYLLDIKIRQAEKMLLSSQKSITDIAEETGFSTTSHFISQFKNKNGITPLKFRNKGTN